MAAIAKLPRLTIHPTKLDETTGGCDPRVLPLVGGLVIERHRFGLSLVAEYRSRIARVGLGRKKSHISALLAETRASRRKQLLTTIILPSGVMMQLTAVQPDGSLKKLGSGTRR
jgi:hypothetical protein